MNVSSVRVVIVTSELAKQDAPSSVFKKPYATIIVPRLRLPAPDPFSCILSIHIPKAPLTASAPAVAPAPKMAALPNFLPNFLTHSPCCQRRVLARFP